MLELNKIYCMDNVQGMKQLDNESVDLVVTSPPYDNLRNYNEFSFDFENVAKELFRIVKVGGVVVWVVGDATINGSETGTSFKQALYFMQVGFNLHDTMIYAKESVFVHDPRNKRYKQAFEYMFVFSKGTPNTYNEIKDKIVKNSGKAIKTQKGRNPNGEKRFMKELVTMGEYQARFNIWSYYTGSLSATDKIAFSHPAIFPEQLVKDHILSWSNEGDVVLDPFMGSGTTAKVARALGRKYIGFEISQEYVDLANKRLQETKTLFD